MVCTQSLLLVSTHFVVGDTDRLSTSAVLSIQPHHCVRGRSGASEEVDYGRIRVVSDEESERILDRIERLGIGKLPVREKCGQQSRPAVAGVMR